MNGLCDCGCGGVTNPVRQARPDRGLLKGQPQRFIRGHSARVQFGDMLTRTRCKHGHDLTAPDARTDKGYCRVCIAAMSQRGYQKARGRHTKRHRENKLRRKYGITTEQFDAMAAEQGGLCAICRQPPTLRHGVAVLHVDHDHRTHAIRGLLCAECNFAIGKFGDSPALLRRAADYLDVAA